MHAPDASVSISEERLPFEPRTLLAALRRKVPYVIILAMVAVAVGLMAAITLARPTYLTQAVVLYKPITNGHDDAPSITTVQNTVIVDPVLQETIQRMHLHMTVEALRHLCEVNVRKDTSLLDVVGYGPTPQRAADLANTLCQVFLDMHQKLREQQIADQIQSLENRVARTDEDVKKAQAALDGFCVAHGINNADDAARQDSSQAASLAASVEEAVIARNTAQMQLDAAEKDVTSLTAQVNRELAARAQGIDPQTLSQRETSLREKIREVQSHRVNETQLAAMQKDLDRAAHLRDMGLISQAEYDKMQAAYDKQKAVTDDTLQTASMRHQLAVLQNEPMTRLESPAPSQSALDNAQSRAMTARIDLMGIDARLKNLRAEQAQLQQHLKVLPALMPQLEDLRHTFNTDQQEAKDLHQVLDDTLRMRADHGSDFTVISQAPLPTAATYSHRKLIAAGVAGVVGMLGLAFLLGGELLEDRVRSGAEMALKTDTRVLGVVPALSRVGAGRDWYGMAARELRNAAPGSGARILLTSAEPAEGCTTTAVNLAKALARQGERVLLVDGNLRADAQGARMEDLLGMSCEAGVSEALAAGVVPQAQASSVPGLSIVGRGLAPMDAEQAAPRLRDLLPSLSAGHSIVLVDGPPSALYVEADMLARGCDGLLLVARARRARVPVLRRMLERLRHTGSTIVGSILNDVDSLMLEIE
ncbi:MAG: polysaccharide biosynthesis tyrosine autokinase [Candidatus Xenobia bacterium]